VLIDLMGASETIWQHSSPSKIDLAHMMHLVFVASLNNNVYNVFGDHLGAMKICSWSGLGSMLQV